MAYKLSGKAIVQTTLNPKQAFVNFNEVRDFVLGSAAVTATQGSTVAGAIPVPIPSGATRYLLLYTTFA